MTYDLEKYRDKREKVLGVKKRGISFGTLAALVSVIILVGLGSVVIPQSVAFLTARNLDDAIFKLNGQGTWPEEVVAAIHNHEGVKSAVTDHDGARVVITFDRSQTDADKLTAFFARQRLDAILLNQVGHSQRLHTLQKEGKFEAL